MSCTIVARSTASEDSDVGSVATPRKSGSSAPTTPSTGGKRKKKVSRYDYYPYVYYASSTDIVPIFLTTCRDSSDSDNALTPPPAPKKAKSYGVSVSYVTIPWQLVSTNSHRVWHA